MEKGYKENIWIYCHSSDLNYIIFCHFKRSRYLRQVFRPACPAERFPKPFLTTPLHTHTGISSKFHVINFNSQDIFFYIYIIPPVLPICAPWNSNSEKCRNWFLRICMKNVLVQFRRRYLILWSKKCQKHKCSRYPRFTL